MELHLRVRALPAGLAPSGTYFPAQIGQAKANAKARRTKEEKENITNTAITTSPRDAVQISSRLG